MKKNAISIASKFLAMLFICSALSFQACVNTEKEQLEMTQNVDQEFRSGAICEISNEPENECATTKCICPTYFELLEIQGENSYISFTKLGGQGNGLCYQISEPGIYCLALEGGEINQASGTNYQVALFGLVNQNPRAVISLRGSCSTSEDYNDYEMVYLEPGYQFQWDQWACSHDTFYEVQ